MKQDEIKHYQSFYKWWTIHIQGNYIANHQFEEIGERLKIPCNNKSLNLQQQKQSS